MTKWIKVEDRLPNLTDEYYFVEVKVKTDHDGEGRCLFGYSGAMGEPMTGSFWMPIRDFKGDVYASNNIIAWQELPNIDEL